MRTSLLSLLAIGLLATSFSACGGGTAGMSPEEVLVAFSNELADLDFNGAKRYATSESAEMLDMMGGMAQMAEQMDQPTDDNPERLALDEVSCNVDGNAATCMAQGQSFQLVQEGGSWKVNFSKSGMGLDGMEGMDLEGLEFDQ